jgi:hypothetical protein
MHGIPIKIIDAQQARIYNTYKNTKLKLLKTNAAIWFNKICREKRLKPTYISIFSNGKQQQDKRTMNHAIRYRINQEIKFQYRRKQHLNDQLYKCHLLCAHHFDGMWQHINSLINKQLHELMECVYQKLNKKLDTLTLHKDRCVTTNKPNKFQSNVINLSNIHLSKEQLNTLSLGPNYAIEKEPKTYLNNLIIDTEMAIRQLEPKIQNTYRHIAARKIKHITNTNRCNILHKRYQYNMRQIKKTLKNNNLTTVRADKAKAIVIINKEDLRIKVNNFIRDNNIHPLSKDPTEYFQKQIQQAIQKCNLLIDKHAHKYYLNIKPAAPQLNVYLKTHKENQPIRPIINNTQAPAYNIAKHMNRRLKNLINLPYTYSALNSQEVAEELTSLVLNEHMRIITMDIKDMYVNLPTIGILTATRFWLNKNNVDKKLTEQSIHMTNTILTQNYFQYDNQTYQPHKGIAMGSPISSTMAEIYIQLLEETSIKHCLEVKQIIYYRRYVDDILIIYDHNKTNETILTNHFNNMDKHLEFKITTEDNSTINYLDLSIHRNNSNIDIGIYRKPTETGTIIHATSNHPLEQKMAALNCYIHRLLNMPLTNQAKQIEWDTISTIAKYNGYHPNTIHNLKTKILNKEPKQHHENTCTSASKRWTIFNYYSPLVRKITNIFKHTNLRIVFRTNNTIQQQLSERPKQKNPSGIYSVKCNTCNLVYVGQSGRAIDIRFKEHIRYIRTNNPTSAYASHILQNIHEYGTVKDTLRLLQSCRKGKQMNCWETLYIQMHQQHKLLVPEQPVLEANPLFELAIAPPSFQHIQSVVHPEGTRISPHR